MELVDDEILDRLPIFIILNKRNFQTYPQILKLFKLEIYNEKAPFKIFRKKLFRDYAG